MVLAANGEGVVAGLDKAASSRGTRATHGSVIDEGSGRRSKRVIPLKKKGFGAQIHVYREVRSGNKEGVRSGRHLVSVKASLRQLGGKTA
jgi:hypothetical protein